MSGFFNLRWLVPALSALLLALGHGAAWSQKVRLDTSLGEIVIQLDAAKAPKSVANFLEYVKAGHYNGTIFHRVIPNFMIQGGGFDPEMTQKPTRAPIPLESQERPDQRARHRRHGAHQRAPTRPPHSFSSILKDNAFLDSTNTPDGTGYAVFGKVVVWHGCGGQDLGRTHGQQGPSPERAGDAGAHSQSHCGELR